MSTITPKQLDELLPQTQCGLCGYGGCMPYAEAMVFENAPIHLCPPGGIKTLRALGAILEQDPAPYLKDMEQKTKPKRIAIIREAECIGCTLCIKACPVDAIIGSAKQMHSVLTSECTGCELCVSPCPVDCIDLVAVPDPKALEMEEKADYFRQRFQARQQRLSKEKQAKEAAQKNISLLKKQKYIAEAIERARVKKLGTIR